VTEHLAYGESVTRDLSAEREVPGKRGPPTCVLQVILTELKEITG
jgi:hypothetical protein